MKVISEPFAGVKLLKPFVHEDARGSFVKPYHIEQLGNLGIHIEVKEEFFSVSNKNVLRGMHFQLPPHAHQKLVYCVTGHVLDVIVDIRKESATFGRSFAVELSEEHRHVLFLPVGIAHGFLSLKDSSCLIYKTDAPHHAASDAGIRWDSFGYAWGIESPQLSNRDESHPAFDEFHTPF